MARHWLMICPKRRGRGGEAPEPKQNEINSICNDLPKLKQIRRRLSDISWWMRLLCQKVAQKANREDEIPGRFWEARFQSVKILDETGLLACAAYVDLNPIRADLAELLENFGELFSSVAGRPTAVDAARSRHGQRRFHATPRLRELFES